MQFFFGSEPTLLDIVAFSFIGMALAVDENDDIAFKKMCEEDFQNLKRHFERVKAKYWPDWDEKVSRTKNYVSLFPAVSLVFLTCCEVFAAVLETFTFVFIHCLGKKTHTCRLCSFKFSVGE